MKAHEDQDYVHSKSAHAWKTLTAEVNKRKASTFIQISKMTYDELKHIHGEADEADEEEAREITNVKSLKGW